MAKNQPEDTLADFTFDDGDEVFSNFRGDIETPVAAQQTKPSKTAPLPEFEDDGAPPVNIDKVKTDAPAKPIPSNSNGVKKKVVAPEAREEEQDEDEEIPDSAFNFGGGGEEVSEPSKPKPKAKPKETPKAPKEEEPEPDPDEVEEEEEEEGVEKDSKYYTNLALDLKDRGTFREVEIDENVELTEDEFFDLQEKEFEVRMDEAFAQFAEDMDDDGKDFIKAKKKGMHTRDFLMKYLAPTFDLPDFDSNNKNHVSKVINHYLTSIEGLEGEELEDRREWLKNGGKETTYAQNFYNKIQKIDTARKQNIMAALDNRAKEQEDAVQEFNVALAEVLDKTDTVGVFKINKGARKEIYEAITKPTIKAKKGSYVPKLVARVSKILSGQTEKDLKDLIALTMILESDFKLPSLKEDVETQVTREAKARIGKKQPKSSTDRGRRELADFF
jgi:ribosomal protein S20